MYKIMLTLHLVFVIFAVGPMIHATTTASRGLRTSDAGAIASSSKATRIYSYASILAVVFGIGLMSVDSPYGAAGEKVAGFSEPWLWISLVLWFVAVVVALVEIVPTLDQAAEDVKAGKPVSSLVARVASSGGVIAVLFLVTVFLMVYKPGG